MKIPPKPPDPPVPPDPPDFIATRIPKINHVTTTLDTMRSNKQVPSQNHVPLHQSLSAAPITESPLAPQFRVSPLLHVPVLVNEWIPATALVDSGATCNFTSLNFVTAHQLPRFEIESITVDMAVNQSTAANQVTTIELTLPCGFRFHLTAVVVPDLSNDIILGINFLKVFDPKINWKEETISIDRTKINNTSITNVTDQRTPIMLQSYTIEPLADTNDQSNHPERRHRRRKQRKTKLKEIYETQNRDTMNMSTPATDTECGSFDPIQPTNYNREEHIESEDTQRRRKTSK